MRRRRAHRMTLNASGGSGDRPTKVQGAGSAPHNRLPVPLSSAQRTATSGMSSDAISDSSDLSCRFSTPARASSNPVSVGKLVWHRVLGEGVDHRHPRCGRESGYGWTISRFHCVIVVPDQSGRPLPVQGRRWHHRHRGAAVRRRPKLPPLPLTDFWPDTFDGERRRCVILGRVRSLRLYATAALPMRHCRSVLGGEGDFNLDSPGVGSRAWT